LIKWTQKPPFLNLPEIDMTQNKQVLDALKRGPLTPIKAMTDLGVMRLAGRVHELRLQGVEISTRIVKRNGKSYAEYRLIPTGKDPDFADRKTQEVARLMIRRELAKNGLTSADVSRKVGKCDRWLDQFLHTGSTERNITPSTLNTIRPLIKLPFWLESRLAVEFQERMSERCRNAAKSPRKVKRPSIDKIKAANPWATWGAA
jgi:hypothetical protein